jgi:hypothetical protein
VRPFALVLLAAQVVLACGGDRREPRPEPETSVPTSPSTPPLTPAEPDPPPLPTPAADALECHVEPDLQRLVAAAGNCCGPSVELGIPEELRVRPGYEFYCGIAAVDGVGTVAIETARYIGFGGYWMAFFEAVRPSGGSWFPAVNFVALAQQEVGFLGLIAPNELRRYELDRADPIVTEFDWGARLGHWNSPSWHHGLLLAEPDQGGGITMAMAAFDASDRLTLWVGRAGADGTAAWGPIRVVTTEIRFADTARDYYAWYARTAFGTVLAAEDGAGRVLVLWDGAFACGERTTAGRWYARDGSPLSPVFLAANAPLAEDLNRPWPSQRDRAELVRLADGSLALQDAAGVWMRRFADGVPAGGPVPEWLAVRRGEHVRVVPGSSHVALVRGAAAENDGRPRIDVVDESGAVCASVALPPQSFAERSWRGPLREGFPSIGADGTIVQLADEPLECGEDGACRHECAFRLWPRALRERGK